MHKLFSEKRAQGSLEYLIIIGGAVLIAVVIGYTLKQASSSAGTRGQELGDEAAGNPPQ